MEGKYPKALLLIAAVVVSGLGGGFIGYRIHESTQGSQGDETQVYLRQIDELLGTVRELQESVEELEDLNDDLDSQVAILEYRLRRELERQSEATVVVVDSVETDGFELTPTSWGGTAGALQYTLPLESAGITNYGHFTSSVPLSGRAEQLLLSNGFVVIENPFDGDEEYIQPVYDELRDMDIPIFVTSDSLLHLYHIQFDETLRRIEEATFYGDIWNISRALYDYSAEQYNLTEGKVREAHRRNAAYLAVGLCLLKPGEDQITEMEDAYSYDTGSFYDEDLTRYGFTPDAFVEDMVEGELANIEGHSGFSESGIFLYREDYSQYVPRGHYTRSEKLRNYFKAVMWYGRMSMLLKGDPNIEAGTTCSIMPPCTAFISEYDAEVQTLQACLLTAALTGDTNLWIRWNRVYEVTSFYVGVSDDLGPYEYLDALQSVFTGMIDPGKLDEDGLLELKLRLAEHNPPAIYGGTGNAMLFPPITPDRLDEVLEATMGFRLMGQRFVPDSYIFQELVVPRVHSPLGLEQPFTWVNTPLGPTRGFPRGLDVMAVLGSSRAREILDELKDSNYENYDAQFDALKEQFDNFTADDWGRNLYWSWLYTLKPLLEEYEEGYPTFMQTEAWTDKQLTTALASWTELRHDTILYAKQSYSVVLTGAVILPPAEGYVEPVPEFYARLLDLTKMTRRGLTSYGVLDETSARRLSSLEDIISRLIQISEKELLNEPLTQDDCDFIRDFADELDDVLAGVDSKAKKTTLVADVHTDTNTNQALEEATGYVRLIVVAYRQPDGSVVLGAGPVFSYYEFKQPISQRLTDEAWREKLAEDPPDDPEWVDGFTD